LEIPAAVFLNRDTLLLSSRRRLGSRRNIIQKKAFWIPPLGSDPSLGSGPGWNDKKYNKKIILVHKTFDDIIINFHISFSNPAWSIVSFTKSESTIVIYALDDCDVTSGTLISND